MLKTGGSPAKPGSLCQDDSSWLQSEQGRRARQEKTRDAAVSEVDNAGASLPSLRQAPDLWASASQLKHRRVQDKLPPFLTPSPRLPDEHGGLLPSFLTPSPA